MEQRVRRPRAVRVLAYVTAFVVLGGAAVWLVRPRGVDPVGTTYAEVTTKRATFECRGTVRLHVIGAGITWYEDPQSSGLSSGEDYQGDLRVAEVSDPSRGYSGGDWAEFRSGSTLARFRPFPPSC